MKQNITKITSMLLICGSALIVKTNTGGPGWSLTNAPITSTTTESNCTNCHNSFSLQTSGTNHGRINLTNNLPAMAIYPTPVTHLFLDTKRPANLNLVFK